MPATIKNPGVDGIPLPFPFEGMLKGGQTVALNLTAAQIITALGGAAYLGGLVITDLPATYTGPFDAFYQGAVGATAAITGGLTLGGDIAAAGGFRHNCGTFHVTTAASQTGARTNLGGVANGQYVAPRAGSLTAFSAMLDVAITGAATQIVAKVFKNGTLIDATAILTFTQAGAEVKAFATFTKDAIAFAAGDLIDVRYDSTGITNTPKLWASVEIEN